MKWLKDGISLDETKVSALIISFFITLGFAMYQVIGMGDIADNLLYLLGYEIGAFTGIKVAETISNKNPKLKVLDSATNPIGLNESSVDKERTLP